MDKLYLINHYTLIKVNKPFLFCNLLKFGGGGRGGL